MKSRRQPSPMSNAKVYRSTCPTCGADVKARDLSKAPFFPFCGRRCKLVDLGKWFDGEHRIEQPLEGDSQ